MYPHKKQYPQKYEQTNKRKARCAQCFIEYPLYKVEGNPYYLLLCPEHAKKERAKIKAWLESSQEKGKEKGVGTKVANQIMDTFFGDENND